MSNVLVTAQGGHPANVDRGEIERLLVSGTFFWLDLFMPSAEELAMLSELFGFHPLALEDTERFGQRPKIDDYEDFTFLVVYGAADDEDRLVEVHCFFSERCLVTVHRDDCPAFASLREHYLRSGAPTQTPIRLLHEVIDYLVDSFFPVLTEIDDELDELEEQIARGPQKDQLQTIFRIRRRLVGLRKVVVPQRDLIARLATGVAELPGMTPDDERYFRDVYDHQIRIFDLLESYRDLLSGAHDVYLSTVSNRLSEVTKQLAVIATVFLPLTFVTGFFGQNFGWMVSRIGSGWTFLVLGIGTELLVLAVLIVIFRRRGWF
jgi:magnesium transporter